MTPASARRRPRKPAAEEEEGAEGGRSRRAIWKGTVTFGLVEIPVALHGAIAREEGISFTLLDRHDFSPVGYERVSKATGKPVAWDDIVRGFEREKGEYVVLSDEEIRAANVEASQTIEILDFVEAAEIDPIHWDEPYYLEPLKGRKSRSYALLREVLRRTERVGIAKVVLRTRQRLAALGVRGDALVLDTLRYAHEIRGPEGLSLPTGSLDSLDVTSKEIGLAERLVESMSGRWDPSAYRDEYRDEILALVERKAKAGKAHVVEKPAAGGRAPGGEVLDLMPLLERSMERRVRVASAERERHPPKTARRKRA
jgi:DNA end-binding protein Ku